MDRKALEKELKKVTRQEYSMLLKNKRKKGAPLEGLIGDKVPAGLADTLNGAFEKSFKVVFEKGTSVINMTFNEKTIKGAEDPMKESQKRWLHDMLITSVEGTGLGLLGVGIPDIPVFTGVILRSVYQTALCYDFSYDSTREQIFILKVIEGALARGEDVERINNEIDSFMTAVDKNEMAFYGLVSDQIARTSKALSDEVLYMKFIQTVPIVGAAGGLYNPFCLNRVKNFADIKYQKRSILKQLNSLDENGSGKIQSDESDITSRDGSHITIKLYDDDNNE